MLSFHAVDVTWEQACATRVARGHLDARVPRGRALDVVSALCGLHAQVMSSAELSLWARVEDITREEVRAMLWEQRTLVKTWAMRGTLHIFRTDELPLWFGALATYRDRLKPAWFRAFEITPEGLETFTATVAAALEDRMLTRAELGEEVLRRTGDEGLAAVAAGCWGPVLKPAAWQIGRASWREGV